MKLKKAQLHFLKSDFDRRVAKHTRVEEVRDNRGRMTPERLLKRPIHLRPESPEEMEASEHYFVHEVENSKSGEEESKYSEDFYRGSKPSDGQRHSIEQVKFQKGVYDYKKSDVVRTGARGVDTKGEYTDKYVPAIKKKETKQTRTRRELHRDGGIVDGDFKREVVYKKMDLGKNPDILTTRVEYDRRAKRALEDIREEVKIPEDLEVDREARTGRLDKFFNRVVKGGEFHREVE